MVGAGPATVAHGTAVDAALPLGVVTLVCRQPSKGPFHVERTLIGSTGVDFDPLTLERQGDRCVQLRDVVSAGAMGPGGFRYTVRVLDKRGAEVSAAKRDFSVVAATGSTPSSR